mgnify:FL=1
MVGNPLDLVTQDPLDFAPNPNEALVSEPGLFDGALDGSALDGSYWEQGRSDQPVQQELPPGAGPVPKEDDVLVAGWGKAITGIMDARKILKEHEAANPDDAFKRSTPRKQGPNEAPNANAEPETLTDALDIDPDTAKIVETPEGATAVVVPVDAEAVAAAQAKYQRFTTDTPFSALDDFNPSNLNSEQDVLALIAAHSEVYRDKIDDATGGVITHEVTRHMADLIGSSSFLSPDGGLLKKLLGGEILHGKKPGEVAANMLAARDLLVASASESDRLAKLVSEGNLTDLTKAGFNTVEDAAFAMDRQFALNASIHQQVKGAQTEIARTLSAHNVVAKNAGLRQQAIGDVLQSAGSNATAQERAIMYLAIEDPIRQAEFLRKGFGIKVYDALYEVWINALLSSPVTHIVNLTGNLMFSAGQIPTRTMAGMMGHMRRKGILSGDRTGGVYMGDDVAMMMGGFFASWDAVKLAGKAFKDPAGEMSKLEPGKKFRMAAASAEAFGASGILGKAMDLAGSMATFGRLSTRSLTAGDVFFKAQARQASIYMDAVNRAGQEGITDPRIFAEAVADGIANPTVKSQQASDDFARLVTFQSTLGEQGRNLQGLASHSVIRWFVPFLKTPMNIVTRAWEHTPFNMFSQDYKKAIAQGGEQADLARARVALGTVTMGAVALAAKAGYITGGGPSDPRLRANLVRQGWQPYSIRIGDTYYSFKRVEPFATVMGLAVDLVEIGGNAKNHDDVAKAAAALGMAFSKNVTSKTWTTGMANLLEAIENPDRYGPEVIKGFIRSMVPRLGAQIEKGVDPQKRYVRTLLDAIKQDVPGWSSSLPADLNLWGEAIVYQTGGFVSGMLNPFYSKEYKPNELDGELDRLEIGLPRPPETIPGSGGTLLFDPFEYHDFSERAGKIAKANMLRLVGTESYKNSNDLVKEMRLRSMFDASKTEAWGWMYHESKWKDDMKNVMNQLQKNRVEEFNQ